MCSKETEFKVILFSLCYFHAVVCERRKFGPQGWNRSYPFNNGDLTISAMVLYNYLEANSKVPWEDLRYLFGEIMYGGHITDDWDRRLDKTYLEVYMHPIMVRTIIMPEMEKNYTYNMYFIVCITASYSFHKKIVQLKLIASYTEMFLSKEQFQL